jgi:tRNA/tmRNA/rRNA uracil-C5-methylase (TrmA/RlmC/RlmD family)
MQVVCARVYDIVKDVQDSLPVYDGNAREGVWRTLMVRASVTTGEMMAVFTLRTAGLDDDGKKQLKETLERLVDVLSLKAPVDVSAMVEVEKEGGVVNINKSFPVTSLFVQHYDDPGHPGDDLPLEKLHGADSMVEVLGGLRFQVLAGSFFQVNTKCAELLFDEAREWICNGVALPTFEEPATVSESTTMDVVTTSVISSPKEASRREGETTMMDTASAPPVAPPVVLLDVCCGTGTIGLLMASNVSHVVGVEMCQPAVDSARLNATENAVGNTSFVCARAEQAILPLVLEPGSKRDSLLNTLRSGDAGGSSGGGAGTMKSTGLPDSEIGHLEKTLEILDAMRAKHNGTLSFAVIVDPPRAGLHHSVINCLHNTREVSRVVYVSCNPTGSFVDDFVALCRPRNDGAPLPFRAISAKPFDMFPHTPHCELLCLFERLSEEEAKSDRAKDVIKRAEIAAGGGPVKRPNKKKKKKPCRKFAETGICKFGDKCKWTHDVAGAQGVEAKEPLRVCFTFKETGVCSFGDNCHFDHGEGISAKEAYAKRIQNQSEVVAAVAEATQAPAVVTDAAAAVTDATAAVSEAAAAVTAAAVAVTEAAAAVDDDAVVTDAIASVTDATATVIDGAFSLVKE